MDVILLTIPWLGPSKNFFKGKSWKVYNTHKDTAREAFSAALRAQYPGKAVTLATPVKITFRAFVGRDPITKRIMRAYDKINYADCFKMLEDAAVKAGIIPDDRDKYVDSIEIQTACPFKDWWKPGLPTQGHIVFEIKSVDK